MQETAEQYRQRMLVLVDGKDPVKLQVAAPARLAKLLKGVSPARARKRPGLDKWSIAEIVVHMADTEVVFGYLIRGIVGEPGTRIDGFNQDAWLAALHYDKLT
jgi:DinB superfamily